MDSGKVEEWLELETGLMQITSLLGKKFLFCGALHPIAPSLLGFPATFRTRRAAVSSILASRDWFVIWMGLLSFIIAQIEFVKLNHAIPDWFQYLVDKGISQMWLSGLHQSGLCNFAVSSFRVGVFIDWLQKDTSTPPLELFTAFNVPVWYPWTTELGDLVARTPALANLQPLPEHLQAATTFIFRQPKTYSQLIGYPMSNFLVARHSFGGSSTISTISGPIYTSSPISTVSTAICTVSTAICAVTSTTSCSSGYDTCGTYGRSSCLR